jgi:membrane protease YdiL (CAAX protease family)
MSAERPTLAVSTGSPPTFSERLRGWGPVGVVAFLIVLAGTLVFMPIAAALVFVWKWLSKTPWRDIGFARPKSLLGAAVVGVLLGVALKFAMKAVVLPLLGAPAVAHNSIHDSVTTQAGAISLAAYAIYGAGFAEEVVFRGYWFERLGKLFGKGAAATFFILVIVTALFGAAHWQQGLFGVVNALGTGFVLGIVYLATGRRLWVPMFAHAAFDLSAVAMIYWGLETQVSRLVFR